MINAKEKIMKGMADILWGLAWADHVEEYRCFFNLSGLKIEKIMPSLPDEAYQEANKFILDFEKDNKMNIVLIFDAAKKADNTNNTQVSDPERFGNCLAYMSLGHGVSWFDDHADFDLKIPYQSSNLVEIAESTCRYCAVNKEKIRKDRLTVKLAIMEDYPHNDIILATVEGSDVHVWADEDRFIAGDSWKNLETIPESCYALIVNYNSLVDNLRKEGYTLDLSDYELPKKMPDQLVLPGEPCPICDDKDCEYLPHNKN